MKGFTWEEMWIFFCREQEKGDIGPINTKPEFWQILEVTCKPVL